MLWFDSIHWLDGLLIFGLVVKFPLCIRVLVCFHILRRRFFVVIGFVMCGWRSLNEFVGSTVEVASKASWYLEAMFMVASLSSFWVFFQNILEFGSVIDL